MLDYIMMNMYPIFFHILSTDGVVGQKQNLPAPAPNDQTRHIPSVLDLRRLYVESNCPAF
jgi:hypothetical protein